LANAYGPYGKDNVIPALIQKCREAQLNNTVFDVLGDGSPKRDFIFIQDVRKIVEQLMHIQKFGSVIISSGTSVYIRDVVEEIVRAVKFDGEVNWKTDEFVGQESKIPSNEKLRDLLPDLNFTPLRQGIEETVNWFEKNKS
jgi:nucleoside-diphosphate-sugar epimerase